MYLYWKRVSRTGAEPSSAAGAGPSDYDNLGYDNQGYHHHPPMKTRDTTTTPYMITRGTTTTPFMTTRGTTAPVMTIRGTTTPLNILKSYHHHHHPDRQTPKVPRFLSMPELGPVPVNRTDIDIDVDAIYTIPERKMEMWGEYEGIWESDDLSDGDTNVPGLSREEKFPIRGRENKHPVATFNDTTAFEEADISFFGPRIEYNHELAAGQLYTNIDELIKKINETHVHSN